MKISGKTFRHPFCLFFGQKLRHFRLRLSPVSVRHGWSWIKWIAYTALVVRQIHFLDTAWNYIVSDNVFQALIASDRQKILVTRTVKLKPNATVCVPVKILNFQGKEHFILEPQENVLSSIRPHHLLRTISKNDAFQYYEGDNLSTKIRHYWNSYSLRHGVHIYGKRFGRVLDNIPSPMTVSEKQEEIRNRHEKFTFSGCRHSQV